MCLFDQESGDVVREARVRRTVPMNLSPFPESAFVTLCFLLIKSAEGFIARHQKNC